MPVAATAAVDGVCRDARDPRGCGPPARWWPDWRRKLTWQLGLLMGGTGGLYFSANAFVPDYLHAIGRPELVAPCLGALNSASCRPRS